MSLVTVKFSHLQLKTIFLQSITLRQLLNGNSEQSRTAILTLRKTAKLQAIRRF